MKELGDIEQLYRKKLEGHQLTKDNDSWEAIKSKMSKPSFFRFSPSRMNAYYIGALSIISVAAAANYGPGLYRTITSPQPEKEVTISAPAHTTKITKKEFVVEEEELIAEPELIVETVTEPKVKAPVIQPEPVKIVSPEKEPAKEEISIEVPEPVVENKEEDQTITAPAQTGVVYVKSESVVRKDTVKVKKRRVRKRK